MKRLGRIATIITALLLALAPVGCLEQKEYESLTRTVFSSGIVFSASVRGGDAKAALNEMSALLDEVGASVNASDESSYVARFNASGANERVEVDHHTYFLASEAKRLYEQTDGAFNVALGKLSTAWHVDVNGINAYGYSSAQPESLPEYATLTALSQSTDLSSLFATQEDGKYYLTKTIASLTLDLGGIAKGYCTDACRAVAVKHGAESALINLSGNIALIGKNLSSGGNWGIGVNNPRTEVSPDRYVCGFYDADCGIATSGDYERRYFYDYGDGEKLRVCHIVSGKTLCPVGVKYDASTGKYESERGYVISATVRGESAMLCDVYATAVCVLGLDRGREFLNSVGYSGILFTSDEKCAVVGEFALDENTTLYRTGYERV